MGAGIFVGGIEGKPQWEGFRKTRDESGPRVIIPYLVEPASNADLFADACLGGVVHIGGPTGKTRYVPTQQCPTNPSMGALTASMTYQGERNIGAGGIPVFQTAVVAITYGLQPWPGLNSDDPGGEQAFTGTDTGEPILFAECEIDYGQDIVVVGEGSGFWLSDSKPMHRPRNRYVGTSNFRLVRHFFPYLPYALIMGLVNRINATTMFAQGRGQVRFAGGRSSLVMTSDGTKSQRFEQNYEIRQYDWNMFPREDKFTWDYLVDTIGNYLYDYVDLTPLIK
jgi:hypothetical protein